MVCSSVREKINSLKLVDYFPVRTLNPYYIIHLLHNYDKNCKNESHTNQFTVKFNSVQQQNVRFLTSICESN